MTISRRYSAMLPLVLVTCCAAAAHGQRVDWPTFSGDPGAMRWSPVRDVNRANVSQLRMAWSWKTGEHAISAGPGQKSARPGLFQASPVVIHDTMYVSTPCAAVVALDARTGRELWRNDPEVWRGGQPSNGTRFVHRGVATWTDGHARRVFINARWKLVALDAASGRPIPSFGDGGEVNLVKQLRRAVNKLHYINTSPPVVAGNLVSVRAAAIVEGVAAHAVGFRRTGNHCQ